MPQKIHVNTFEKGLSQDLDTLRVANDSYREGKYISLTEDDFYGSATPVQGSTLLQELVDTVDIADPDDINVMAIYECNLEVSAGSFSPGLVIFLYNEETNTLTVWLYRISNNTLTTAYSESSVDYQNKDIDGRIYTENGVDILYFTDQTNKLRRLVCSLVGTPYTTREIDLRRRFPVVELTVDAITASDGNLQQGSYQFAYRLINSTYNRFSTWSLLTTPVSVTGEDVADLYRAQGGTGGYTDKSIDLSMASLSTEDAAFYDKYQLAVVKNISGTNLPATIAYLIEPQNLTGTGGNQFQYTYRGNESETVIDISDITIEDAAIDTVGTLTVKNNRIIGGNINYTDLSYDNGDPIVANTTTVLTATTATTQPFDITNSDTRQIGYFRDEVYRFGITYVDEYGNWSPPKVLDFSSVTANSASTGIDWKFPSRSEANRQIVNSSREIR